MVGVDLRIHACRLVLVGVLLFGINPLCLAQSITIGATEMPLGVLGFADQVQHLDAEGCGAQMSYLGGPFSKFTA